MPPLVPAHAPEIEATPTLPPPAVEVVSQVEQAPARLARPSHRPTWAEVNLEALRANIRAIAHHLTRSCRIMAVVKADGYGHGVVPIARAALEAGATHLAVATSDEALDLRETPGFRRTPILVTGPTFPEEAELLQEANIAYSVGTLPLLRHHLQVAGARGRKARIHLQVETGIGRDGFRHDDPAPIEEFRGRERHLEAVWTHFSVSDELDADSIAYTREQCRRLLSFDGLCRRAGMKPLRHAANSGGVLFHRESWLDLVRPGIMIYGANPSSCPGIPVPLRPVMTVRSRLAVIRTMEPGDCISYGREWTVPSRRRIGTIPIGYGDGYPRALSNRFFALVRGQRVPIRGRVCMDQIMVDLDAIPQARAGDEVVLFGAQGPERLPLEEAAAVAGTIPYELTCQLTHRVPRVYTESR